MRDSLSFRMGASDGEQVTVRVSPRDHRVAGESAAARWVDATIEIAAGAFRGAFRAMLQAEDFVRFRDALRPLYARLSGRATFDTPEEWLRIDVEGDGKGHFQAIGEANDQPAVGNRLIFKIELDQTELPALLRSLDALCEALLVLGVPRP